MEAADGVVCEAPRGGDGVLRDGWGMARGAPGGAVAVAGK